MRWISRISPGPRELPEEVRTSLASRFNVDSDIIERAKLVAKAGQGHCRDIRIYDPSLMGIMNGAVKKYDDLATHRQAILFEGRIEKDGAVYLADRRPPKTVTRRPSKLPAPSPKPNQAT